MKDAHSQKFKAEFHANSTPPTLFPFDPWGAEQAVAVIDRPFPGLGCAMIGPFCLGHDWDPTQHTLHCLAVTEDGAFASNCLIYPPHLRDPGTLWHSVIIELETARQRTLSSVKPNTGLTPQDCLSAWSDMEFWAPKSTNGDPMHRSIFAMSKLLAMREQSSVDSLSHDDMLLVEAKAQATIQKQVSDGLQQVLSALEPELCSVVMSRPHMSVLMAHHLLQMARQHSPAAATYAMQALKTESLGLLHLVVSGLPVEEARGAREAIFNGGSLPNTLRDAGVSKAAHRRSLVRQDQRQNHSPEQTTNLCELPISGGAWLMMSRLIREFPLGWNRHFDEFGQLIEGLHSENFQKTETVLKLLSWCSVPRVEKSAERLQLVLARAREVTAAASYLTPHTLSLEDAVSRILNVINSSTIGRATIDGLREILGGIDIAQLLGLDGKKLISPRDQALKAVLDVHPGVPNAFQLAGFASIHPLNSIELALAHGVACEICLQDLDNFAEYVGTGSVLYAVRSVSGVAGTIALKSVDVEGGLKIQVEEVSGANNSTASMELYLLAQSLAASFSSDSELGRWRDHDVRWLCL